jgi:hypothetical protein
MLDQREAVVGQDVGRVSRAIVRLGAVAVPAQVRQDDTESLRRHRRGVTVVHPVDGGVGEIAVDQYDRPSLSHLAVGELGSVVAAEIMHRKIWHADSLPGSRRRGDPGPADHVGEP